MTASPAENVRISPPAPHRLRKIIKWIVYPILIFNLFYYLRDDADTAQHTLNGAAGLWEMMAAFAATLDDFSWIILLFIYEIETFWLPWDFKNRFVSGLIIAIKAACYALIFHTSYTYIIDVRDLYNVAPLAGGGLCDVVGEGLSFLRHLDYTAITADNCSTLTTAGELFRYPTEAVVTDIHGLAEERTYRTVNIVENLSWLVILFLTEAAVQLQNRGWHEGAIFTWTNRVKDTAYVAIICAAIYWVTKGRVVDAWDEFVWIAGFAVLDMNLAEWRDDLEESETLEEEAEMLAGEAFDPSSGEDEIHA
ncbi:MAG: hypothetical protein R3C58_03860 [Parvularculaceae bacterium]